MKIKLEKIEVSKYDKKSLHITCLCLPKFILWQFSLTIKNTSLRFNITLYMYNTYIFAESLNPHKQSNYMMFYVFSSQQNCQIIHITLDLSLIDLRLYQII